MNWKEQYFAILNKANIAEVDLNAALRLKLQHLPQFLYRYRSLGPDGRTLESLKSGLTWLSAPKNFNDPFDCALTVSATGLSQSWHGHDLEKMLAATDQTAAFTPAEVAAIKASPNAMQRMVEVAFQKEGKAVPPEMSEMLADLSDHILGDTLSDFAEKLRDSLRVCCFCENVTSILMWSHYARDHTGFCLEYDLRRWRPHRMLMGLLHPVYYSSERFDATAHMHPGLAQNVYIPLIASCNKSKDWEYEQEWRLVAPGGVINDKPHLALPLPNRIILGAKADEASLRSTLGTVHLLTGVPIVKAKLSKEKFAAEI